MSAQDTTVAFDPAPPSLPANEPLRLGITPAPPNRNYGPTGPQGTLERGESATLSLWYPLSRVDRVGFPTPCRWAEQRGGLKPASFLASGGEGQRLQRDSKGELPFAPTTRLPAASTSPRPPQRRRRDSPSLEPSQRR